jgi:5'-3' exoribonuclease 1
MGPTHRIPEEKMFLAIFNYIEHLYGKIKPKKLFFMAVDGRTVSTPVSS